MARFLEYIPGTSFLHCMNPLAKLACALLISIACFCSTNIIFLACILVLDFALAATCKMTRQATGLAKAVAIFSIILAIIALLTTPQGTPLRCAPLGLHRHGKPFGGAYHHHAPDSLRDPALLGALYHEAGRHR